jgi:phosphate transport system substrate-binding protein
MSGASVSAAAAIAQHGCHGPAAEPRYGSAMEAVLVGDYRLIATLGRGGMAEVFLAVRGGMEGFHKLVVIKQLRSDLLAQPQAAKFRALLLDEARLAARLSHPNIVQTFEVGDQQGQPWLAMEYLDGQPLSQVLTRARRAGRPLPVDLALQVVVDALAGLGYAHDLADFDGTPLRIVHRDVSPQNVFWTYDGAIKLVDFGVAKFALNTAETEVGIVKGKLTYMAPEQARGQPIDRRADLFVAGILLWELLAGRRLLRAPTQVASLERLLFEQLPSLSQVRPDLDPELARICERALERDVDRRYATAAEMRADLERVLADRAPRRADLEAFIQPLFVDDRAEITRRIREAIAGRELISLSPSEPPATDGETAAGPRTRRAPSTLTAETETTAAPAGSVIQVAAATPGRRRWLVGLGIAVVAVIAADVLLWRQPGGDGAAQLPPVAAPEPHPAAAAASPAPVEPPAPPAPPALQLCGSNTVGAELAPALVEAFLKRKGAAAVTRASEPEHARLSAQLAGAPIAIDIRAAGSATAFQGLLARTCDVGMASRAINDQERAQLADAGDGDLTSPATEHVIGLDGIAVIVHPNNPLGALDRGQLHDVFTGKLTDWSQLGGAAGPITIRARDNNSGTFDTFKALVLGGDPLAAGASRFADSSALSDQVAGDPSAIGFIGLAYIRSARALAVGDQGTAARLPTSFTVTTEGYMLSRRLYMYTPPTPRTPLATELVSFALSPAGQAVVRDAGFIDLTVALRDGEPCDTRCPRAYAALIAHAQRLSLDFRFRSGSDEVDSRATRDLDRVVQFLRDYPGAKLLLLGFSDAAGATSGNVRLSQHRAATIARELELRGVHAQRVESFGAAMPVAPNASEADRQRNRRVEVWLETAR